MIRVRFAPSPTGYLHVGGARTALFNWLFARRHGGSFVLRIEDTDEERNTEAAYQAIYDGLKWLGLDWDEGPDETQPIASRANRGGRGPYFQSQRNDIYEKYLTQLLDSGHAYVDPEKVVRLRSPKAKVTVQDLICGDVVIDRSQENDTALRRSNGGYIFHFVNVVDDLEMGITHVIRGEDHLMNTPKHLEIFQALGVQPPAYAHIPLILNMKDGSKMSKRDQGAAVQSYIDEGFLPPAVVNFLCLLGWSSKDDRVKMPLSEVLPLFDWDHLNRAPARFDYEKCVWLNTQYLAEKDESSFADLAKSWLLTPGVSALAAKAVAPDGELLDRALALLRPKIKHLPELAEHFSMLFDDEAAIAEDARIKCSAKPETAGYLAKVVGDLASLEAGQWTADGIKTRVEESAKELAIKPGAVLFPLRVALTGQGHGADLMPALELLGQATAVERLRRRCTELFGAS